MIFEIIDFILRVVLIGFFAAFFVQSINNFQTAKDKSESQAEKYFLAHMIFFFISLISFIQAEVDLFFSIYPASFVWKAYLGEIIIQVPIQSLLFIGLLVPSIIPIVYVIERELLSFKFQILTGLGIIITGLLNVTIFIPVTITFTIIPVLVGTIILCLSFISIYFKLILDSDGFIRRSAIYSFFGWISLVIGFVVVGIIIVIAGDVAEPTFWGVVSHSIAIGGVILIFNGSRIIKSVKKKSIN